MERGFPGFAGRPVRPYPQYSINENSDVDLSLQYLDHYGVPVTAVTITYQIDNLTDNMSVLGPQSVTPTGSTSLINIPGSINIVQRPFRSSQLNQVKITVTFPEGGTATQVAIYEIIALQTPQGG